MLGINRNFLVTYLLEFLIISSIIFAFYIIIYTEPVYAWDIQIREDKWTLLMLAHAPRYGKAQAAAACLHEDDLYILIGGFHNYILDSVILRPEDGQCCARFQKCKWLYEKCTATGQERFLIETKYDVFLTYNVYGSNRSTCEDDIEYFCYDGIWSINFTSKYTAQDRIEDNPSNSWYDVSLTVQHNQYWAYELTISVRIRNVLTVGAGKFYFKIYPDQRLRTRILLDLDINGL